MRTLNVLLASKPTENVFKYLPEKVSNSHVTRNDYCQNTIFTV